MRVPHLLVLGAAGELVGRLLGQPVAVTVISWPRSIDALIQSTAVRCLEGNPGDSEAMLRLARMVHAVHPFDAVLPIADSAVPAAAAICAELGLAGMGEEPVRLTRDKALARQTLAAAGLDRTRYRLAATVEEAADFLAEGSTAIVVKPVDGSGSDGVHLVTGACQLAGAWEAARAASRSGRVLVEEQLVGPEFSVETVSARGVHTVLAVTAKTTTGPPRFIETGHAIPAPLDATRLDAIQSLVDGALTALGVTDGPCHTEVIVSGEQAHLIEVNARFGGDWIWELVQLATDVDLVTAAVDALVSGRVPAPAKAVRGAAIRFYSAPHGGIVDAVTGMADVAAAPGVVRVGRLPGTPMAVRPMADGDDRLGHVVAIGADAAEAAARAEHAVGLIGLRLVLDSPPAPEG